MERSEILAKIGEVIEESAVEDVDWSNVSEATTLESFGFDSLAILDLLFDLEQEFDVEITAKELLKIATTGDLVSLITERLAA